MTTFGNSVAIAIMKIVELFGRDYVKANFKSACCAHPSPDDENETFFYFCGFKGDSITNRWTEFAYIRVNRNTKEAIPLDYRLPDGTRMESPLIPIRLSA